MNTFETQNKSDPNNIPLSPRRPLHDIREILTDQQEVELRTGLELLSHQRITTMGALAVDPTKLDYQG